MKQKRDVRRSPKHCEIRPLQNEGTHQTQHYDQQRKTQQPHEQTTTEANRQTDTRATSFKAKNNTTTTSHSEVGRNKNESFEIKRTSTSRQHQQIENCVIMTESTLASKVTTTNKQ